MIVNQAEKYGMMMAMQTPPITLFGIPNCSSVKKARQWMDEHQVLYHFHDFKKNGLDESTLDDWLTRVDWTELINRKGTTWRGLSAASQSQLCDAASAKRLMIQHPSLVKRPVVVAGQKVLVGVNPAGWASVI